MFHVKHYVKKTPWKAPHNAAGLEEKNQLEIVIARKNTPKKDLRDLPWINEQGR
jgi:hypothetical protein